MEQLLPAKESECPLQKENNPPFIEPLSLSLFIEMNILLCTFLFSMPYICYLQGSARAASREKTSLNMLLQTTAGYSRCTQERITNSRQRAIDSFEICRMKTKARC